MEIVVKARHTEVAERFRQHAAEKLSRVERLDPKVIRIDVEHSHERNPRLSDVRERIELTCHSRGPVIRAEAAAGDPYAALDLALSKLEARLRRAKDRRKDHHGGPDPVPVAAEAVLPTPVPPPVPSPPPDRVARPAAAGSAEQVDGDGLVVREKVHQATPMTLDQALFEMELVGHDFFLFVDADSDCPSVVYRRHAYDYGVIRLQR
ncbi:ribosome-associated translation inhibitor RaiA [soil metagenome]